MGGVERREHCLKSEPLSVWCQCSPSTFNPTPHLCAERNGRGAINHHAVGSAGDVRSGPMQEPSTTRQINLLQFMHTPETARQHWLCCWISTCTCYRHAQRMLICKWSLNILFSDLIFRRRYCKNFDSHWPYFNEGLISWCIQSAPTLHTHTKIGRGPKLSPALLSLQNLSATWA